MVPQVGYITQILQPPINYIIIAVIIGVMVVKHFAGKEKKKMGFQYTKDSSEGNEVNNTLEENKDESIDDTLDKMAEESAKDLKKNSDSVYTKSSESTDDDKKEI